MSTLDKGSVVSISENDTRLITVAEVRDFSNQLSDLLEQADLAQLHVGRLASAEQGSLGGWPEGFVFSTEAFAACHLLANVLSTHAEFMQTWAERLRDDAGYLYSVRGPGQQEEVAA